MPGEHRSEDKPKLVYESRAQQRPCEGDASVDSDVSARSLLQRSDVLGHRSLEEGAVRPLRLRLGRGEDVLWDAVDEARKGFNERGGPVSHPVVVGAAAEEDVVLPRDGPAEVREDLGSAIGESVAGLFGHPVE